MNLYTVTYCNGCGDHATAIVEARNQEDALDLAKEVIPEILNKEAKLGGSLFIQIYEPEFTSGKGRVIVTEDWDHEMGGQEPVLPEARFTCETTNSIPNFVFGKVLGEVNVVEIQAKSLNEAKDKLKEQIGDRYKLYQLVDIKQ